MAGRHALESQLSIRPANTRTADYTFVLTDAGKAVEGNAAGPLSLTVPPNSSVPFALGTIIEVPQVGVGAVTLVAGGGVTITGDTVTPGQGGSLLLRKTGTNAWRCAIVSFRAGTYVPQGRVKRYTTTAGDGSADDTAALQAFLATLTGTDYAIIPKPLVAYVISGTLTMPQNLTLGNVEGVTVMWENVLIRSSVANGPAIDMSSETQHRGRLVVNCLNTTGSIGVRFGGVGTTYVRNSTMEQLSVVNAADAHILFTGTATQGCYYNHIGYAHVAFGAGDGVRFDSNATPHNTNTNSIGYLSAQLCGRDGVRVNKADGNRMGYVEAESNTGYGINIIDANGFFAHGWLEGNTAGERFVGASSTNISIQTPQSGFYNNSDMTTGAVTASGAITANSGATSALRLVGDTLQNVGSATDANLNISAKGTGLVAFGATANSGSGGVQVWSGGTTPVLGASISGAGAINAASAVLVNHCFANSFYSQPFTSAAISLESGAVSAAGSGTDQNLYLASKGGAYVIVNGRGGDGTLGLLVSGGGGSPTTKHILDSTGHTFSEGVNIVAGTTTGTKIGTATTQKLGFWNATPVVQQARPTDAASIITLLTTLGLCA